MMNLISVVLDVSTASQVNNSNRTYYAAYMYTRDYIDAYSYGTGIYYI